MSTTETKSLDQLRYEILDVLRRYLDTSPEARTPLVREFARLLVDVREHFIKDDGTPDWQGRSYPYRRWVSDVYRDANVTGSEKETIQSAVRYHVGGEVRSRLSEGEAREQGFDSPSPKERSNLRRNAALASYKALVGDISNPDPAIAISAALNLLDKIDPARALSATSAERNLTVERLDALAERVRSLRNLYASLG